MFDIVFDILELPAAFIFWAFGGFKTKFWEDEMKHDTRNLTVSGLIVIAALVLATVFWA